jgi:hypothetical protein
LPLVGQSACPTGAQAYVVAGLVPVTVASFVVFGLPIIPRSELTGAHRERVIPQVGVIAGVLQCATALAAVWIGAFARPLGVALFGAILLLDYRYHQRLVYRVIRRAIPATYLS